MAKKAIPTSIRRAVALKYGCPPGKKIEAACHYCGRLGSICWHWLYTSQRPSAWVSFSDLELDHLHPEALGGPSTAENIVLACRRCNRSKGSKPLNQWIGT